jgi:hypothetical protein
MDEGKRKKLGEAVLAAAQAGKGGVGGAAAPGASRPAGSRPMSRAPSVSADTCKPCGRLLAVA